MDAKMSFKEVRKLLYSDPGFLRRGCQHLRGRQPIIWPIFPKKCIKYFMLRGASPVSPGSATDQ